MLYQDGDKLYLTQEEVNDLVTQLQNSYAGHDGTAVLVIKRTMFKEEEGGVCNCCKQKKEQNN